MKLAKLLMSLMILSTSIKSFSTEVDIPTLIKKVEICDQIIPKCHTAIKQKDETIKLLEMEVKLEKKNKPKSNWLLWLLGGVVTGLVVSK